MEMVYGGIAAMLVGWWAGRRLKLDDDGVAIIMTMAGAGSIFTGLPYLWIGDVVIGREGNILTWGLIGAAGGVLGVITYLIVAQADWFVDLAKRNGLL